MTHVKFSVLTLAALACGALGVSSPDPDVHATLPDTVALRIGEAVRIGPAVIGFVAVPEDGRCPKEAMCVWAGNAVAEVAVSPSVGEGPTFQLRLNTTLEPRAGEAWGLRIELLDLTPLPVSTRATPPQDYRLLLWATPAGPK